MNTYRLRVEGPLHREREPVADAVSTLGGHVVSVDLREVDGPRAVDEIVVELPGDLDGGTLTSALEDDPEATLLSSHGCERDEPARHARNWAERSREPDLSTKLEVACPLSTSWIKRADEASSLPPVAMALERGGPVALRSWRVLDRGPDDGRGSVWLLAVPDRYPDAQRVALLTRPLSLRFSATEVARVEVLLAG